MSAERCDGCDAPIEFRDVSKSDEPTKRIPFDVDVWGNAYSCQPHRNVTSRRATPEELRKIRAGMSLFAEK